MVHEGLQISHEHRRQLTLERPAENAILLRRGNPWRLEKESQRTIAFHGARDIIDRLPPRLQVTGAARQLEQRLRVIAGDRCLTHQRALDVAIGGSVDRNVSTSWRFLVLSRFSSMTLLAPKSRGSLPHDATAQRRAPSPPRSPAARARAAVAAHGASVRADRYASSRRSRVPRQ